MRLISLPFLLAAFALATTPTAFASGPTLPTTTTLTSAADPAGEGLPITLTAVVEAPGWPGGSVTYSDYELGTLQSAPVQEGKSVVTLAPMAPGLHLLSADYSGDGVFAPSSTRLTLRVGSPVASTVLIGADHNPATPGQRVTLTASLQTSGGYGMASGTVTLLEGGIELATLPVSLLASPGGRGGSVDQLSFATALPAGVHSITAVYSGDGNLTGGASAIWTEVVGERVATTTTLAPPANPSLGGQTSMLTATVAPATPASKQPSGTLTFSDGAIVLGRTSLAAGAGSLAVSLLDAGAHALTVAYSGDGDFLGSTSQPLALQVLGVGGGPAPTATALAAGPNPAAFGQVLTFKASVAAVSGAGSPAGSVYFAEESGAVLGSATLDASGQAMLTTSRLSPGTHRVKAVYAGGNRFAHSSSEAFEVSVERAQASVSAVSGPEPSTGEQGISLAVAISGQPDAPPGGSVTFVDQGAVLGTVAVGDQGQAHLDTAELAAGLHRMVAVYNGDGNYGSVSAAFTVLVPGPVTSSTSIHASQRRVLASHDLTLTATVAATSPSGDAPAGVITFKEGDAVLGTGELDGQGSVELTLPALPPGQHTIVASFPGSGSLGPSSGTVTVQVLDNQEPRADSG
ncbi:MAG: Ig-like domain-containing protein [Candidatus Dormibacteraeota bacterium]|nr:Ig-like domain-containing protein [Candidatus Dormibacteraeota bacterium]